MKKRILSIALVLFMPAVTLPALPFKTTAATPTGTALTKYSVSGGTLSLADGGTYYLNDDIDISKTIEINGTVTLDLNGHVLKMTENGRVITINNTKSFILDDSNSNAKHSGSNASLPDGGVITGGNISGYGAGVYIGTYSTFTMNGGTIYNCITTNNYNGGGVSVYDNGKFIMNGGAIRNCSAYFGGGIYSGERAEFIMNGGAIYDCTNTPDTGSAAISGFKMYTNGGTVKGTVDINYGSILKTSSTDCTEFYDKVKCTGTINGGVFYGGIDGDPTITGTDYSVSFNLNGGSGSAPTQRFINTSTATVIKPVDPTRNGYIFAGWYNGTTEYDFSKPVTASITLNAKWISGDVSSETELKEALGAGITSIKLINDISLSNTLKINNQITLDLNGHVLKMTGSGSVIEIINYKSFTLNDSNPNAKHSVAYASLPDGGVITGGKDAYGAGIHLNMYATLTMNGGTIYNCTTKNSGGGVNIDIDAKFIMNGGAIRNCTASSGGGVNGVGGVDGHNDSEFTMNGGAIYDCTDTSHLGDTAAISGFKMYTNGGTVKGTVDILSCEISKTGSAVGTKFYDKVKCVGTMSGGVFYGGINGNPTITGTDYSVSFDLNGAIGSLPTQRFINISTVSALKPTDPTPPLGKRFTGWYTDREFTNKYEFDSAVTSSITLYAGIVPITYEVTYNSGADGTGSIETDTKIHGTGLTLSTECFTREGFVQVGWSDSEGGRMLYELGGTYTSNADITLYPVWDEIITITVPFTTKVELGDNTKPEKAEFELELIGANTSEDNYADVTVTGSKIETDGEGSYNGTLSLTGPSQQIYNMLCDGAFFGQKNTGKANWTYDDTVWALVLNQGATACDADSADDSAWSVLIYPTICEESDNGNHYTVNSYGALAEKMTFTNTYTKHTHKYEQKHNDKEHFEECVCGDKQNTETHKYGEWKVTKEATENAEGEKKHTCSVCGYSDTASIEKLPKAEAPKTGDNSHAALWFALVLISGGLIAATGIYRKKRDSSR